MLEWGERFQDEDWANYEAVRLTASWSKNPHAPKTAPAAPEEQGG